MTHHPYESFHSSAQPQGLYLTQNSNKQQGAVLKCLPDFFASGQEAPIQQQASKNRDPCLSKGTQHMPVQMNYDITQTS